MYKYVSKEIVLQTSKLKILCWSILNIYSFINSPGNYSCACNVGYELYSKNGTAGFILDDSETGDRDGDTHQINKTCVPVMCPKLTAPENGQIVSTKVSKNNFI